MKNHTDMKKHKDMAHAMESSELEWDYEGLLTCKPWSFNSFLDEYNHFYELFNKLQSMKFLEEVQNGGTKNIRDSDMDGCQTIPNCQNNYEEQLQKCYERFQDFLTRSHRAETEHPNLKDDIICRLEFLSAKWDIISSQIIRRNKLSHRDNEDELKDLKQMTVNAEQSLHNVERRMSPLIINATWTEKAIKEKKNEIKVCQSDLDAVGKILKSVITHNKEKPKKFETRTSQDIEQKRKLNQLESRWYRVCLQLLEWQCFIEGLRWTCRPSTSPHGSKYNEETFGNSAVRSHVRKRTVQNQTLPSGPARKKLCTSLREISKFQFSQDPSKIMSAELKPSSQSLPNCDTYCIEHNGLVGYGTDVDSDAIVIDKKNHDDQTNGNGHQMESGTESELYSLDDQNFGNNKSFFMPQSNQIFSLTDLDEADPMEKQDINELVSMADNLVREHQSQNSNAKDIPFLNGISVKNYGSILDHRSIADEDESSMSCSETESSSNSNNVTLTLDPGMKALHSTPKKKFDTQTIKDPRAMEKGVKDFLLEDHSGLKSGTDVSEAEFSEFWDQEKYLSEHNYDEPIDEASALRLLNFGDDYRNFIDSLSDNLSTGIPDSKRVKRRSKKIRGSRGSEELDSMSESDFNDANNVLFKCNEAWSQLNANLRDLLIEGLSTIQPDELKQWITSCEDNIAFLRMLLDTLSSTSKNSNKKKALREGKALIRKWEKLMSKVSDLQNILNSKISLENRIKTANKTVEEILMEVRVDINTCKLADRSEQLKTAASTLIGLKTELFNINLGVHNLLVELNSLSRHLPAVEKMTVSTLTTILDQDSDGGMTTSVSTMQDSTNSLIDVSTNYMEKFDQLKEAVLTLYTSWDEALHEVNAKILDTESLWSKIQSLEEEAQLLVQALERLTRRRRRRQRGGRDNQTDSEDDSGISESFQTDSDSQEGERIRTKLEEIIKTLERTNGLNKDYTFIRDAIKAKTSKKLTSVQKTRLCNSNRTSLRVSRGQRDLLSRALRVALPLQALFVLFWLLTWIFEPSCCENNVNSLRDWLTPKFHYLNGPPPI